MYKNFLKWIVEEKEELESKGIITDNIKVTPSDIPNPSVIVDHITESCIGRVSVWETGQMDLEIIHLKTEKRLFYKHYDLDCKYDFGKLLKKYFNVMISGKA